MLGPDIPGDNAARENKKRGVECGGMSLDAFYALRVVKATDVLSEHSKTKECAFEWSTYLCRRTHLEIIRRVFKRENPRYVLRAGVLVSRNYEEVMRRPARFCMASSRMIRYNWLGFETANACSS